MAGGDLEGGLRAESEELQAALRPAPDLERAALAIEQALARLQRRIAPSLSSEAQAVALGDALEALRRAAGGLLRAVRSHAEVLPPPGRAEELARQRQRLWLRVGQLGVCALALIVLVANPSAATLLIGLALAGLVTLEALRGRGLPQEAILAPLGEALRQALIPERLQRLQAWLPASRGGAPAVAEPGPPLAVVLGLEPEAALAALAEALARLDALAAYLAARSARPGAAPAPLPEVLLRYLQQLTGAARRGDAAGLAALTAARLDALLVELGLEARDHAADAGAGYDPDFIIRPQDATAERDHIVTLLPALRHAGGVVRGVALVPRARP